MENLCTSAACIFVMVIGVVCLQGIIVASYVRLLRWSRPGPMGQADSLPRAAVVLALRGAEPHLGHVIERLLDQDYPRYLVWVVVDNVDDPAWSVVTRMAASVPGGRLHVEVLRQPSASCSLKCSALVQAVEGLGEHADVIAFIDADTNPYRTWLRDLVTPLADTSVGVTTGNRWYLPRTPGHGGLVRHYWNAGAVVQVWFNGIPWAGSMAMRRETLWDTGVIDAWRRSLSVDGAVGRRMRASRRQVWFVPTVMMANYEDVSRRGFSSWLVRQLVAARSSGAGSVLIPAHASLMLFCLLAPIVVMTLAVIRGNGCAATVAVATGFVYWAGSLWSATSIDRAVCGVLGHQQSTDAAPLSAAAWQRVLAVMDAHLVHLFAFCQAVFRRRVTWRGIEYVIGGPESVQMAEYVPFGHRPVESGMSIT